ncbi:MAG: cellulase family glycosylhydrolase [Flavisolibacter sp.]|nr:cellulase family glycosylhydrolase [Flavisolibacter sp.]
MKCKFLCLSLLFLFIQSAAQQRFFTTKGKEIMAPDGKPFLIRGTNLGNWLVPEGYMFKFKNVNAPRAIQQVLYELIGPAEANSFWSHYLDNYITQADIKYLKSIGANSIRLPFHYKLFTNEDYLGSNDDQRGFHIFDRLLNWCRQAGLSVILDMHCAPGGQTGDNIDDSFGYPFLFESERNQELAINIWVKIAGRYKNDPLILGYDLLNEPIAHFFDTERLNPKLEPLYKKMAKAIRTVDPNHIIFLGGAQWNSNFKPFGAPFDKNLVYTFHKYWTDTTQKVIQEYLDFRDKYNVPIYVGETGENKNEWINSFRQLVERNNVGWHFWPYKKMDDQSGIVTFLRPAYYDSIINYAETPRINYEAIRKSRPKNISAVKKTLDEFLNNCLFANCKPNEDYIRALGLAVQSVSK